MDPDLLRGGLGELALGKGTLGREGDPDRVGLPANGRLRLPLEGILSLSGGNPGLENSSSSSSLNCGVDGLPGCVGRTPLRVSVAEELLGLTRLWCGVGGGSLAAVAGADGVLLVIPPLVPSSSSGLESSSSSASRWKLGVLRRAGRRSGSKAPELDSLRIGGATGVELIAPLWKPWVLKFPPNPL